MFSSRGSGGGEASLDLCKCRKCGEWSWNGIACLNSSSCDGISAFAIQNDSSRVPVSMTAKTLSGNIMTKGKFLELLASDDHDNFILDFSRSIEKMASNVLGGIPFWECAPFSQEELGREFECKMMSAQGKVSSVANGEAFTNPTNHFSTVQAGESVAFPNPTHDTMLVTIRRKVHGPRQNRYANIASFVREADNDELISLWKCVAKEALKMIEYSTGTFYIYTDGTSVPWIHVRIGSGKYLKMYQ